MSGGLFGPGGITARLAESRRIEKEARLAALKEAEDQRKSVHNEQTKLRATAMNVIAAAFVVTGIIAPLTSLASPATQNATPISAEALALMLIWLLLALILHCGATLVLRNLR